MSKRRVLAIIVLGCLVAVTGCGGGNDAGDAGTPVPTAARDAAPPGLRDVVWTTGLDDAGGPRDEVEAYTTISPGLIAVVPAANIPAGTEFTATWAIDGLDVPEATTSVTVDRDMARAWVAFEFIRNEGRTFPLGELTITVTASTGETVQGSATISLP